MAGKLHLLGARWTFIASWENVFK